MIAAADFFPSRTIAVYAGRLFLWRSVAVLAALVLILQTLDLLGESGQILAQPGNGDAQLWQYVALRLPQIVARFLPFSVLLGTLITLATLNQNSEVISMKAAGVSAHQILAPLLLVSVLIALVSFVFNDRIVTRATATLSAWQAVEYGPLPAGGGATNVWVRDGEDLIEAATAAGSGDQATLIGVTIYDRRGNRLLAIYQGQRADRRGDRWVMPAATRFDVASGRETRMPVLAFGRGATPNQFTLANVSADRKSFTDLRAAVGELAAAGRPTRPLEAGLWHKLSGPISSLLMPLLAAVAAFGLARSGQLFLRAVIGMALGFAYFVADNFALAMGNLGAYPPFLAAWGPFLLFLLIGETVLIRTEE